MSHPIPSHDYSEKGKDEGEKAYTIRRRKGMSVGKPKGSALEKAKKFKIKTKDKNLKDFLTR